MEIAETFRENLLCFPGNLSAANVHGQRARKRLGEARESLAQITAGEAEGLLFTSGATESNNLAILGLGDYAVRNRKTHLVCSGIEHSSVSAPIDFLCREYGFRRTLVEPNRLGQIEPEAVRAALEPDTVLISVMQASNETGAVQSVYEIAEAIRDSGSDAFFHCDAAQGVGHISAGPDWPEARLCHPRLDLVTFSGHKMYGIPGSGALSRRRRPTGSRVTESGWPPLRSRMRGGGQQYGLRSGSVPLALCLSLAQAWEMALERFPQRREANRRFRKHFLELLEPFGPRRTVGETVVLPHVLHVVLPGIDSESALWNLRNLLSGSRGSACGYLGDPRQRRILSAMGLGAVEQQSAFRFSWSHRTAPFWDSEEGRAWAGRVVSKLRALQS